MLGEGKRLLGESLGPAPAAIAAAAKRQQPEAAGFLARGAGEHTLAGNGRNRFRRAANIPRSRDCSALRSRRGHPRPSRGRSRGRGSAWRPAARGPTSYDSKRDRLLLFSGAHKQKGDVMAYDMKRGKPSGSAPPVGAKPASVRGKPFTSPTRTRC